MGERRKEEGGKVSGQKILKFGPCSALELILRPSLRERRRLFDNYSGESDTKTFGV